MEGILIPQKIFVGDTAEFIFPADSILGFDVSYLNDFKIEKINQNESMTVTAIRLKTQNGKNYISIVFVPWETGDISFPPLAEAGLKNILPLVPVSSILSTSGAQVLQPPRPPIIIPGTTYLLYTVSFITALFLFAGIIICQSVKKALFSYSFLHIQKKRIRFLLGSLKKMKKKYDNVLKSEQSNEAISFFVKEWLKEFETVLRKYCFSIVNGTPVQKTVGHEAFTYSEIIEQLDFKLKNKMITDQFEDIFLHLQTLRFGKKDAPFADIKKYGMYLLNRSVNAVKICEPVIQKMEALKKADVKNEEAVI